MSNQNLSVIILLIVSLVILIAACRKESPKSNDSLAGQHAVLLYLKLSDDKFGESQEREQLYKLEDDIAASFNHSDIGEYDGNEIGEGFFTIYFYGTDADKLASALISRIKERSIPARSYLLKRYGPPGAKEVQIAL